MSYSSPDHPSAQARNRRRFRASLDALEDRFLLTAGDLDTTFGGGGVVLTSFPAVSKNVKGERGSAYAVKIQSDGKIVAAGLGFQDFAVARYTTTGSLDPTFGNGGKVETDFGHNANDSAYNLEIQPDGKIVVVGTTVVTAKGSSQIVNAVARYNTNGTLDTSFGPNRNGLLVTTINSGNVTGIGIAIQPDGKIVLAGNSVVPGSTNNHCVLARYNPNGSLDTSFGQGGILTPEYVPGASQKFYDLALETVDGVTKLVAAGVVTSPRDDVLARFNLDGSPDASFGSAGSVILGSQAIDFLGGRLAIQADGKIIEAGLNTHSQGAVARFATTGSLDSTFNSTGPTPGITIIAGTDGGGFWAGAVQPADGKIVAAGSVQTGADYEMLLARLNPDGSLDPAFGTDGVVLESLVGDATARDVAIQSDGRIVTAGDANLNGDFAVARFLGGAPLSALQTAAAAMAPTNVAPVPDPTVVPLVLDDPGFLDSIPGAKRRQKTLN
jgi:uncharacterized delta-60 repeat protein